MAKAAKTDNQQDQLSGTLEAVMSRADRLLDVARPEAVFAEPVTAGGRTVITASEVLIATGFGGGGGSSPVTNPDGEPDREAPLNMGMGAGIGGFAQSRPVAVIVIDQEGVRVEPVVDATKLGLAALTVFGSMFFFFGRLIRRARRRA